MVFQVFRKRQKTALAILAIAAMFAFIGGSFFTAYQTGSGGAYALEDAQGNRVVVKVDGKAVDFAEIERLYQQRRKLNSFLQVVAEVAQTSPRGFLNRDLPDAVVALALERKAQRLGIVVTEEEAWDWLKEAGGGKLKSTDFEDIFAGRVTGKGRSGQKLGLTVEEMLSSLRKELAAGQALSDAMPAGAFDTPIDIWGMHAPREVKVSLEFVEVPVAKFLGETTAPSDEEILKVYNERKDKASNPETGFVGFLEPRRVVLQVIEANVDDFLSEVTVTDEEIQAYYEEHKAQYEEKPAPEVPAPPADIPTPEIPAPPEDLPPPAEAAPAPPESPQPQSQPNPESPPEPPAADASPSPAPTEPDSGPAETPMDPESEMHAAGSAIRSGLLSAALGPLSALQTAEEPTAEEPKSDEPAPPEPQPTEPPAEPAPSPPSPTDEPPKDAPAPPSETTATEPAPAESAPTSTEPVLPETPPSDAATTPAPTPPPEPKYKPLEEVKEEIRKTLQREKAAPIIESKMQAIHDRLNRYLFQEYRPAKNDWRKSGKDMSQFVPPAPPDLSKIAAEYHFQFKTIGPLTEPQLGAEAGIGKAVRVAKNEAATPTSTMPELAFDAQPGVDLYSARVLYNKEGPTYYTIWKTEDLPPKEMPLDQVREQVIEVIRKSEALAKAAEAAKALVEKAQKEETSLADSLDPASGLTAKKSDPFPRIAEVSTSDSPGSRSQVSVRIPQIPGADEAFVNEVFKKGEGEFLTLPDVRKENYYAIRVAAKTKFDPDKFRSLYQLRSFYTYQMQQQQGPLAVYQIYSDLGITPPELVARVFQSQ